MKAATIMTAEARSANLRRTLSEDLVRLVGPETEAGIRVGVDVIGPP
jgi:hypothetical protein